MTLIAERPVLDPEISNVGTPEGNWGAFVLVPTADGRTRFIVRSTITNPRIPVWAAVLNMGAFELPHFIMERRMMLTIKDLSEQAAPAPAVARR